MPKLDGRADQASISLATGWLRGTYRPAQGGTAADYWYHLHNLAYLGPIEIHLTRPLGSEPKSAQIALWARAVIRFEPLTCR